MLRDALYFPFINLPNSSWFSRTLLYYESVGTIMPYDVHNENHEHLAGHTKKLLQAELVRPILPEEYVDEIPNLTQAFLDYLDDLKPQDLLRRKRSKRRALVHMAKMPQRDLIYELCERGVASWGPVPWLSIQQDTANDYMSLLASSIGRIDGYGFAPITDKREHLSPMLSPNDRTNIELEDVRMELLRAALPAPAKRLTIEDIRKFKRRFGSLLPDFRFWLEERIVSIADSKNEAMRQKRMNDTKDEIVHRTAEIAVTFEKDGWSRLVFDDLFSVLQYLPRVGVIPKLARAVFKALGTPPMIGPLAYASVAQRHLGLGTRQQRRDE